jgi:hypothetical protein
MREMRTAYTINLQTERKKPFGRPRHRWEDDIRMHIGEI